jgi:hypothetical protein
MAVGNPRNFFHLDGRLCITPTDLSQAFPHGGTALGEIKLGYFAFNPQYESVEAEEHGQAKVEWMATRQTAAMVVVLREYDKDAITTLFPNVAAGAGSGAQVISGGTFGSTIVKPGSLASDKAVKLLFSPRSFNYHPGIILYQAIPLLQETGQLGLALNVEFGFPAIFYATPRNDGLLYKIGKLEDLTL